MLSSFAKKLIQPSPIQRSAYVFFSAQAGTVKWFDVKKGFGFITPEDGSDDVFVHQSVIHAQGFRSLADGEVVEFSLTKDPRGRLRADRVTGPMGAFVQGAPRREYRAPTGGFGGRDDFGGSFERPSFDRGSRGPRSDMDFRSTSDMDFHEMELESDNDEGDKDLKKKYE